MREEYKKPDMELASPMPESVITVSLYGDNDFADIWNF